jgi:hypothetical protein
MESRKINKSVDALVSELPFFDMSRHVKDYSKMFEYGPITSTALQVLSSLK